ncbi:hypothetical protein O181_054021 [Austropuccinia psidii MF-1]|uniref:Uncharacterized protein n=1 Tax=Austropuccinia psidii MF-1 TaxID=1389203 RepID=A0A9Q3E1N5_9BASI|nr:hypothetical protein [Austropuccinia psidii MF-1]
MERHTTLRESCSIKFTHYVEFLPTIFPYSETGDNCTDNTPFTLVQQQTDSKDPIPLAIKLIEKSLIPPIEPEMEVPTTDNLLTNPSLPTYKGYSWILNSESEAVKKMGDIEPKGIFNVSQCPKHHANLTDHMSLNPKAYHQAIYGSNSEEWKKPILSKLKNMKNHQVWSPVSSS